MDFEVEAFALPNDPDKCVLVVRTQASPSAPHMATYKQDNRYYGRFYRRSNFENRIAEEYEVREIMERARRLYLGLEDVLGRRGYLDPLSPDFGDTSYNRRLAVRLSNGSRERAPRWASFLLLPTVPASVPVTDGGGWLRWLDSNEHKYEPDTTNSYLPLGPRRPVLGGAVCLNPAFADGRMIANLLDEYLRMGFDGSVEYGFAPVGEKAFSPRDPVPYFMGSRMLVKLWQTLGFAAEARARLSMTAPHLLTINLTHTEGAILANFARNREDPTNDPYDLYDAPECLEPNV